MGPLKMEAASKFFMQHEEPKGLIVDEPKRTSVCCKMELSLFRELAAAAREKNISLSEEIRRRLKEADTNDKEES